MHRPQKKNYVTYFDQTKKMHRIHEQRINKKIVWISDVKWKLNKMHKNSALLKEWKSEKIMAYKNYNKKIIKEIQTIRFPHLWKISLQQNLIQSIEGLNKSWMPFLEQICLNENRISNIDELKKVYWPRLRFLSLNDNNITDMMPITRIGSDKLSTLNIEVVSRLQENIQSQDLRWMTKIESRQMGTIKYSKYWRVEMPLIQKMLRKRFPKIILGMLFQQYEADESEEEQQQDRRGRGRGRGRRGRNIYNNQNYVHAQLRQKDRLQWLLAADDAQNLQYTLQQKLGPLRSRVVVRSEERYNFYKNQPRQKNEKRQELVLIRRRFSNLRNDRHIASVMNRPIIMTENERTKLKQQSKIFKTVIRSKVSKKDNLKDCRIQKFYDSEDEDRITLKSCLKKQDWI